MNSAASPPPKRPEWSPNLFLGCDAFAWFRLLARNRFAVHRSRWHMAAIISAVSVGNTLLGWTQQAAYGRRIARTRIAQPPVFIVGHWRSGTTLLHELLTCDPRHAFPTTYQCLAPRHALLTRSWLPRWLPWLMPSKRPMDNMATGWDRPQEEEFALCLLGLPSPYEWIAFPNGRAWAAGVLDLSGLSPRQLRRWKATYDRLLREWTFANQARRLVLKSPPNTARISTVLELFPEARFVHMVRDPFVIYPSTLHLWRSFTTIHGLQRPSWKGLEERILDTFVRMYERFEAARPLIPPERLYELRYEDLIRDPLGRLETLYRQLDLGDFNEVRRHVEAYLAGLKDYETNRYLLTPSERRAIALRWSGYLQRYGYETSA
jgi:hypothetical protein